MSSINNKPQRTPVYDDRPTRESRYKSNDNVDLHTIGTDTKPVSQADLANIAIMAAESLSFVHDKLHQLSQTNHFNQFQSVNEFPRISQSYKAILDRYPNWLVKGYRGELESSKFNDILAIYQSIKTFLSMDKPSPEYLHNFTSDLIARVALERDNIAGWTPIPLETIMEIVKLETSIDYQTAVLTRLVAEAGLKSLINVMNLRSYKVKYQADSIKMLLMVVIANNTTKEVTTISAGDLVALLFYLGLNPDDASLNRWLRPHLSDDTDSKPSIAALAIAIAGMISVAWKSPKSGMVFQKAKDASSSRKETSRYNDHADKPKVNPPNRYHSTSQKAKLNAVVTNSNASDDVFDSTSSSLF
jgi:hypothetical protein